VAVGDNPDGPFVLPSAETVNRHEYLIARDLYMYTAGEPAGETLDYLHWILGPEGQGIVTQLGFVPVTPALTSLPSRRGAGVTGSE
jgi:phosphate transport system substrate-binding protein